MNPVLRFIFIICLLLTIGITEGFAQIGKTETGTASFYHDMFVGRKTANGEIFTQDKMTAAHKSLPLGCWVRVTNLSNDSSIVVRINDRMPHWNKRSIDLTYLGAGKLNFIRKGLTKVHIEVIPEPVPEPVWTRATDLPVEPINLFEIKSIEYDNTRVVNITTVRDLIDWETYYANKSTKKKR